MEFLEKEIGLSAPKVSFKVLLQAQGCVASFHCQSMMTT